MLANPSPSSEEDVYPLDRASLCADRGLDEGRQSGRGQWWSVARTRLGFGVLQRFRDQPVVFTLLTLAVLLTVWLVASRIYEDRLLVEQRTHELTSLYAYGNALSEELDEDFAVLAMLRTLIVIGATLGSPAPDYRSIGSEAAASIAGVRSIWIAPKGIVRAVYPLDGNERLLGRNVLEDDRPGVRKDVETAILTRHATISSQFDRQLESSDWIAWLAVYDGQEPWGVVALQLDSQHLLRSLGQVDPIRGPLLAVRDDAGKVVFGSQSVFESDPVIFGLDRAGVGWELGAIPAGGWSYSVRNRLYMFEAGGLVIVLLLVGLVFVIARHQAAENARSLAAAQDAAITYERHRLAAELHDSVTQLIYSDVLLAEASRQLLASGNQTAADQYLGRIGETAQQALKEMRLLLFELRYSGATEHGLLNALQHRLDAVERRAGVTAQLLFDGDLDLPSALEDGLFRVATEALNNSLKHAAATCVNVELRAVSGAFELTVSDNGRGFDPRIAAQAGGLGLTTMRERVERLRGSLMVESAPGEGCLIRATVPGVPSVLIPRSMAIS